MLDVTLTVTVTAPPCATCARSTAPVVVHPFEEACVVVVVVAIVVVVDGFAVVVVDGRVVVVAMVVVVAGPDGCAAVTVMRAASLFQCARPSQPGPKTPTLTTCAVIGSFAGTVHVAVN